MLIKQDVRGVDLGYLSHNIRSAMILIQDIWGDEDIILINAGDLPSAFCNKCTGGQFIEIRRSVFQTNTNAVDRILRPIGYDVIVKPDRIRIEYAPKE